MLKKLPLIARLLAGIALIVGAVSLMTYEEHKATIKYQRECYEQSARVSATFPKQNQPCTQECQDPKNYMPWWYVLVAWPEGITVWALLTTIYVIAWQSWATSRASSATERQAIAILRPKLNVHRISLIPGKIEAVNGVPTLRENHNWRIACLVSNTGGSKARVVESSLTIRKLGVGTMEGLLPMVPHYDKQYTFENFSIQPGERTERIVVLDANKETKDLRAGLAVLKVADTSPIVCYGFIRYIDDTDVARITGFGWFFNKDLGLNRLNNPDYEYTD